jgi:hypothetical protein
MAKKPSSPQKTPIQQAPKALHAAVFRDVNKVLAAHGIAGRISGLQVTGPAAAQVGGPPGKTLQVVCRKKPDGTIVCKPELV